MPSPNIWHDRSLFGVGSGHKESITQVLYDAGKFSGTGERPGHRICKSETMPYVAVDKKTVATNVKDERELTEVQTRKTCDRRR